MGPYSSLTQSQQSSNEFPVPAIPNKNQHSSAPGNIRVNAGIMENEMEIIISYIGVM